MSESIQVEIKPNATDPIVALMDTGNYLDAIRISLILKRLTQAREEIALLTDIMPLDERLKAMNMIEATLALLPIRRP